jgi:succinate dehydrogenase hydrophobic anchor subunit
MANRLYRYLPLGLGEDGGKDRESLTSRFGWRRWSLSRISGVVLVAFVALVFLFHSYDNVRFFHSAASRH